MNLQNTSGWFRDVSNSNDVKRHISTFEKFIEEGYELLLNNKADYAIIQFNCALSGARDLYNLLFSPLHIEYNERCALQNELAEIREKSAYYLGASLYLRAEYEDAAEVLDKYASSDRIDVLLGICYRKTKYRGSEVRLGLTYLRCVEQKEYFKSKKDIIEEKFFTIACIELAKMYVAGVTYYEYNVKYEPLKPNRAKAESLLNEALTVLQFEENINKVKSELAVYRISNTSISKNKSGCYIATAVYGSYDCPQVWTLRRFRDFYLAQKWYGRLFIMLYYAISPTIVKWFGDTNIFKKICKAKLDSMVEKLQIQGFECSPYEDIKW